MNQDIKQPNPTEDIHYWPEDYEHDLTDSSPKISEIQERRLLKVRQRRPSLNRSQSNLEEMHAVTSKTLNFMSKN